MYKSKLQELCQQQKRALPKYTCIKDGDNHRPQFRASVVVGGVTFHTPSAANSSKQALNEAAQLAFNHFISELSDEKSENTEKLISSEKEDENSKSSSEEKCVKQYKEAVTYKSKLQELCQKEKWELPKYRCIRDGADHCPQFKASAVVCGVAFRTPAACNSSKQALNQVAQLAFLHVTSQHSNENVDKTYGDKEVESSKSSEDKSANHYFQEGFKNKLRLYVRRKNLHQPKYSTEKEGHCFKARVCVGELWFTSNELCATAEEAENSAAATALLALLTDASHQNDDPHSYKILLGKLARDEGFLPPIYKTIRREAESFSTTVEVEGEVFQGDAANSEKLAELNAAKAAYTALIERKLFEPRYEVLKLGRRFDLCGISDPQESPTCGSPSRVVSDTKHGTQVQGTIAKNQEMKSYLLCNRVRVFTCMPNVALPTGTVVIPVSEDRWAMVALEFPNKKAI